MGRAAYASTTSIQRMRTDHRGANVAVAEKFLNRANVEAVLQKMGCERMEKRAGSCRLRDPGFACRFLDHILQRGLIKMRLSRFGAVTKTFLEGEKAAGVRGVLYRCNSLSGGRMNRSAR